VTVPWQSTDEDYSANKHPYSVVSEWTVQETLLVGDQIFLGNGIFFSAPVLSAQILIKAALSCYLKTCCKRYLCYIGEARSVSVTVL
jgi:hypothetical protein